MRRQPYSYRILSKASMWALRALLLAIFARYLHVNHNFFAPPAAVIDAPHTSCLASPVEPGLLMKTQHYFKGQLSSVETVALASDGQVFAPDGNGTVWRAASLNAPLEEWAHIGGRPLGAMVDSRGDLLIADAARGLLKVDRDSRRATILTARVSPGAGPHARTPLMLTDDLDIARNGTVYFSDATAFAPPRVADGSYDAMAPTAQTLLKASHTGRLLRYDPASGRTDLLADGLWFANGVALAHDESYVLVVETMRARLLRVWLRGHHAGATEVFADHLPGLPDGVSRASSPAGAFWVACVVVPPCKGLRSLATIARSRLLRWALTRLPLPLSTGAPYGLVLKVDANGRIIQALHDPTGEGAHTVTAVTEHAGKLYLGTLALDLGMPVVSLATAQKLVESHSQEGRDDR